MMPTTIISLQTTLLPKSISTQELVGPLTLLALTMLLILHRHKHTFSLAKQLIYLVSSYL